jgi:hypothetical protein
VLKRKEVADTLELLPLSAPEGLANAAPSTVRPWVVTVVSPEPGIKPLVVGVERECCCAALCVLLACGVLHCVVLR